MNHGYDIKTGYYYRESGPRYYPSGSTEYKQFVNRDKRDRRVAVCIVLAVASIALVLTWLLTGLTR